MKLLDVRNRLSNKFKFTHTGGHDHCLFGNDYSTRRNAICTVAYRRPAAAVVIACGRYVCVLYDTNVTTSLHVSIISIQSLEICVADAREANS